MGKVSRQRAPPADLEKSKIDVVREVETWQKQLDAEKLELQRLQALLAQLGFGREAADILKSPGHQGGTAGRATHDGGTRSP